MAIDVEGLDHMYVTVSDLAVSEPFYDGVMRLLGFRKGTMAIGGEPHCHYFNRAMQYSMDCYVTFFSDPDGVRLEVVALRRLRRLVREHWEELDVFEDPLSAKGVGVTP